MLEENHRIMLDVLDSPTTRFVQEEERRRIARELHDNVIQSLTALVADLEYFRSRHLPDVDEAMHGVARKVETWQELARESLTSMRQTLGGLRQSSDLDFGLEYALQPTLAELRESGYQMAFECVDWPSLLPFEYTSNLFYVVREALINIRKHARASTITLSLFSFDGHLHISIGDDGVGMQMARAGAANCSPNGYHQGLTGLRERVALLGGRLALESAPGRGTRVDVDVPLPWQD